MLVLFGLAWAAAAQDTERLLQQHTELMRASEQALQQHAAATRLDSDLSEDSHLAFELLYATVAAVRLLDFEEAARLAGISARARSAAVRGATVRRQLQLLHHLASASRAGDFGAAASLLGELKEERGHLKLVPDLITLADVWLGWDIGRDIGQEAAAAAATAATAAAAAAAATTAVAAEAATVAAKEAAAEEAVREAEKEAARKVAAEKKAEKEAGEAREHLLKEVGVAYARRQPRVCLPATPCDDAGCRLVQPCSGGQRCGDGLH
jgi:hypothetical protein